MSDNAAESGESRTMKIAVSSASDPVMVKGRRDFMSYRDLGSSEGTGGRMRAQVTGSSRGMSRPTGWHYHTCEMQLVYVLEGWLELEFEGQKVRLNPGDSVTIPGGAKHNETGTSEEFRLLEVFVPAEMGTVACEGPVAGH